MSGEEIQKKIERLERELKQLKLEISEEKEATKRQNKSTATPSIGDRVKILNPNRGQESQGTVVRVGRSNYVTVCTSKGKVVRLHSNLQVIRK